MVSTVPDAKPCPPLPAELWTQIITYATHDDCEFHSDPPHLSKTTPIVPLLSRALKFDFPFKYYIPLSTKSTLSLVNKTFYALLEPLLYSTVICSDSFQLAKVLYLPSALEPTKHKGSYVQRLFFEQPDEDAEYTYTPETIAGIQAACVNAKVIGIWVAGLSFDISTALATIPDWAEEVHWSIDTNHLNSQIPGRLTPHIRFLSLLNIGGQTLGVSLPTVEVLHISTIINLDQNSTFSRLKDLLVVFEGSGTIQMPQWWFPLVSRHSQTLESISLDYAVQDCHRVSHWPLLPCSMFQNASRLSTINFNPLLGWPFERVELHTFLPTLSTVGFLITEYRPEEFRVAFNFLRREHFGEGIEHLIMIHYHNNDSYVEGLDNLFGYDERISFLCRWSCDGRSSVLENQTIDMDEEVAPDELLV